MPPALSALPPEVLGVIRFRGCLFFSAPGASSFAPIPPPPFPSGEGGDFKFVLPGASPPAPLRLRRTGHGIPGGLRYLSESRGR